MTRAVILREVNHIWGVVVKPVHALDQQSSKCGLRTSIISLPWEFARTADSEYSVELQGKLSPHPRPKARAGCKGLTPHWPGKGNPVCCLLTPVATARALKRRDPVFALAAGPDGGRN